MQQINIYKLDIIEVDILLEGNWNNIIKAPSVSVYLNGSTGMYVDGEKGTRKQQAEEEENMF